MRKFAIFALILFSCSQEDITDIESQNADLIDHKTEANLSGSIPWVTGNANGSISFQIDAFQGSSYQVLLYSSYCAVANLGSFSQGIHTSNVVKNLTSYIKFASSNDYFPGISYQLLLMSSSGYTKIAESNYFQFPSSRRMEMSVNYLDPNNQSMTLSLNSVQSTGHTYIWKFYSPNSSSSLVYNTTTSTPNLTVSFPCSYTYDNMYVDVTEYRNNCTTSYVGKYGTKVLGPESKFLVFSQQAGTKTINFKLADYYCTSGTYYAQVYWGDGTSTQLAPSPGAFSKSFSHTYANSGSYTVGLNIAATPVGSRYISRTITVQ